jgi:hypothetical protein
MSITVSSGETYRLNRPQLSASDTVPLQPGSLLIANRLSFIAPAGDIILESASGGERAAVLEIKHVDPVIHTEFMFDRLVLDFANGSTATLNTLGTADNGSIHPYQSNNGTFFLAPVTGFTLPPNTTAYPRRFSSSSGGTALSAARRPPGVSV